MLPHPALAVAALVCGLIAGLATNRLVKQRRQESGEPTGSGESVDHARLHGLPPSWRRTGRGSTGYCDPRSSRRLPRGAMLLNPVLLAAASVAIASLPAFERPWALSQALLMLYLLYPLALVDLVTLTVEPSLILGGLALRLTSVGIVQRGAFLDMLGGLLIGAGLLTVVGFAYRWLRNREGLGDGDALVLALIGAFVGWHGLLPVVLLATASGLVVGIPMLLLLRQPLNTPVPFAPFLCGAGLGVYLLQASGWILYGSI